MVVLQSTSPIASLFISLHHNVSGVEPTREAPKGETFLYEAGWKDSCAVFFYSLVCIVMHAILQEYFLDVSIYIIFIQLLIIVLTAVKLDKSCFVSFVPIHVYKSINTVILFMLSLVSREIIYDNPLGDDLLDKKLKNKSLIIILFCPITIIPT